MRDEMTDSEYQDEERKPRLRVLIADDVQETRRGTRLMLALNPDVEVVAIAHDGRQAIELTKKHRPDIALMDINMPELDGLSAIRAMHEINPGMVCVVISAERDNQILREAMSVGVREYLIKPFTTEELDLAMERASQLVRENKERAKKDAQIRNQREAYLIQLAHEYAKARRTDDQAVEVFEQLAENPHCELRWLMTLAMIYVVRQKWGRLKILSARLENRKKQKNKRQYED
jgi:YesN/AraC family two-component response regulator